MTPDQDSNDLVAVKALVEHVPLHARRVLVVDCRWPGIARRLKERKVPEVHAIVWDPVAAEQARAECDSVVEIPALLGQGTAASYPDLPFPSRYFDAVVFTNPAAYLDQLTGLVKSLTPLVAQEGRIVLHTPNRQRWRASGPGSDPRDMRPRLEAAGWALYGIFRAGEVQDDLLPLDEEGYLQLGNARIHVSDEQVRTVLSVAAYVFVAIQPGYDPLTLAGKLFDAGHPDWAYQVLSTIPLVFLEDTEVCANVFAEIMLCQLAMDKVPSGVSQRLSRFSIAQEAFYRVVARMPRLHLAYQCQAQFWRRLGNDAMAARLLRSILHIAPDDATRAHLEACSPVAISALEDEAAPVWTPPARLPRILFITHPRPHFGLDILYDGLCTVLGPDHVTEYPWKPSLHGQPPKEMANYPCMFNRPGVPVALDALVARIERGDFDVVLFGDLERALKPKALRRIIEAAAGLPLFIVDEQDECKDSRAEMLEHLGVSSVAGVFKREMLAGIDYGPNVYPLPFAYPDNRVPPEVAGARPHDLFWAGHREFGLRRLYLERLEALHGRKLDGVYSQEDYVARLRQSRIGLNIFGCGFDTVRYWELPAHGCMLLAERLPIRIPHNFRDGESAVFFNDLEDLEDKLGYYLDRPDESLRIAQAGYAHLLRHHTGSARARQLLAWIQSW